MGLTPNRKLSATRLHTSLGSVRVLILKELTVKQQSLFSNRIRMHGRSGTGVWALRIDESLDCQNEDIVGNAFGRTNPEVKK